jgi:hypothetical protein
MALAEDLEEELGASLGEWHIAEFVDDDSLSGRRRAPERVLTNGGTFMFMTERGGPMTADALNRILFADEARFGRINRPRPCWAQIGIRPEVASQLIREYIYVWRLSEEWDLCLSDHVEIGHDVLPGLPRHPVAKVCQAGYPLGSRRRPQPSLPRSPASRQYLAALPATLLARAQPEEKSLG